MRAAALPILAVALLAGCVETVRVPDREVAVADEPGAIVVRERPPVLREEIVPVAPGPGYVWRPGRWRWHDGWRWEEGVYLARPHPAALWVPGHWVDRRYGWAWVPGHWG